MEHKEDGAAGGSCDGEIRGSESQWPVLLQLSGFLIARWRRNQRGKERLLLPTMQGLRERARREQGASEDAAADREKRVRERGGVSFDPFGLFG